MGMARGCRVGFAGRPSRTPAPAPVAIAADDRRVPPVARNSGVLVRQRVVGQALGCPPGAVDTPAEQRFGCEVRRPFAHEPTPEEVVARDRGSCPCAPVAAAWSARACDRRGEVRRRAVPAVLVWARDPRRTKRRRTGARLRAAPPIVAVGDPPRHRLTRRARRCHAHRNPSQVIAPKEGFPRALRSLSGTFYVRHRRSPGAPILWYASRDRSSARTAP